MDKRYNPIYRSRIYTIFLRAIWLLHLVILREMVYIFLPVVVSVRRHCTFQPFSKQKRVGAMLQLSMSLENAPWLLQVLSLHWGLCLSSNDNELLKWPWSEQTISTQVYIFCKGIMFTIYSEVIDRLESPSSNTKTFSPTLQLSEYTTVFICLRWTIAKSLTSSRRSLPQHLAFI